MPAVTVRLQLLSAAKEPVAGRMVTAELVTATPWLAAGGGSIITADTADSANDGWAELKLVPQLELGDVGSHYRIRITDSWVTYHCVVPVSTDPVLLTDILVDPATLDPMPPEVASPYLARTELGLPGGPVPLDQDGKIAESYLPAGSGGGAVDSVNGQTGNVVLAIPDSYDDLTGTVPSSALPALAISEYLGPVASQAAMLALTGQLGDWCTRTDLGTNWIITGNNPTQLASWTALSYPAAPVLSVNGQAGIVELAKADIGLGNVSNLAPADLPISTDTQAALDTRLSLALVDAKGDLVVATADGTVTRVPVGADDQVLTADASQPAGLRWAAPAGGPAVDLIAASYGCKAITMDPADLSVGAGSGGLKFISMSSGRLYQMRVALAAGEQLSSVRVPIKTLGAGAGSLWFGVYQADHSPLGTSADVAAAFTTGAAETWRTVNLTAPAATTDGFVWITALSTLDTGPQLCFSEIDNVAEFAWLLNTAGTPNAVRTEGVSALPGTLDPGSGIAYLDCLLGVA